MIGKIYFMCQLNVKISQSKIDKNITTIFEN